MSAARVVKAFRQIVRWAAGHDQANAIIASLRKAATNADLAAFEAKAKLKLPAGLAALYKLHDGQDEEAGNEGRDESVEVGLFPSIERRDLAFLLVPLKHLKGNTPTTKRASRMPGYRLNWVGFGDNYGGDNIVLDLAESTPPKKRGRVLQFNHEYGCSTELAPSFEQYLESIAADLKAKRIKWDADSGLSYVKAKRWDDLIDAGKVEYAEDVAEEQ
jgi:cell wall assembly regulator SMI1